MKSYYVYILTNAARTVLYIGVTNDLARRMYQHRSKTLEGFTKQYNCSYLLYYEETASTEVAIAREKQLKGLTRAKKDKLIDTLNPHREDLSTTL